MRFLAVFLAASAAAFAIEGRNVVDYRISARLVADKHAVEGRELLTWHNLSPNLIDTLQFHLYMNAFRDKKSSFAKESERSWEGEERGWIDVKRFAIQGGPDLTKSIRYIHPDDDNADDRTVFSVALPAAVLPGGSITVAIDFYTKLPHDAARAGYHGNHHMFTQWFPKIGVWEAAGERHSPVGHWNCHQYHASTEFYADYGRYHVSITVPSNYVVGATGVDQSHTTDPKAGTTTHRFVQTDVHDFAWTAQPGFVRVVREFEPEREVTARELAETARPLNLQEAEVRLKPVRMILLAQPEHRSQIDDYFRALRTAIKYFGLWYGAYPYQTITVVDPPYGGGSTGGMEYPTLITGGTGWIPPPDKRDPAVVTVHEFGHQYWYGMVGNNEFEESWLDEGFNTYSTARIMALAYGPGDFGFGTLGLPLGRFFGLPKLTDDEGLRGGYLASPTTDNVVRNGWQYASSLSYGVNSYPRTATLLRTLENCLGTQTMARIMRTYFQRWKYRHPASQDFIDVVNEVSGRDMKWFFDQTVFGSSALDYAVDRVKDDKVRIRREGEVVFPVEVRVRFKDGKQEMRQWDGQYRWVEFRFPKHKGIASVEVDPGHKLLLDVNFANNSYTTKRQNAPLAKWNTNLLFWAEQLLLALAGVA